MSRTYKCTKGNSKRIQDDCRDILFHNWEMTRKLNIDYNDGSDSEWAIKLRSKASYTYSRRHNKYARKHFLKQERSVYKKNLNNGLNYGNWDELYLTYSKKVIDRYT